MNKTILHGNCLACKNYWKMDNKHKLTAFIIKNPPKNMYWVKDAQGTGKGNENSKPTTNKYKLPRKIRSEARQLSQRIQGDELKLDSPLLKELLEHYSEYFKSLEGKKDKKKKEYMYRLLRAYKIPVELSDRIDYLIFNGVFDSSITKTIKKTWTICGKSLPKKQAG